MNRIDPEKVLNGEAFIDRSLIGKQYIDARRGVYATYTEKDLQIPKKVERTILDPKKFETNDSRQWHINWILSRKTKIEELLRKSENKTTSPEKIITNTMHRLETTPEFIDDDIKNAAGRANHNYDGKDRIEYKGNPDINVRTHELSHIAGGIETETDNLLYYESRIIKNICDNRQKTDILKDIILSKIYPKTWLKNNVLNKEEYYKKPTEIKARLDEFRHENKLDPTKDYTIDEFKKIYQKRTFNFGINMLKSIFTVEELLQLHNNTV